MSNRTYLNRGAMIQVDRHRAYNRRRTEFQITVAIADYLDLVLDHSKARFSHFPAGEARTPRTGAKLKRMGLRKGWPDFLLIFDINGHASTLFFEVKSPTGTESPAQKDFAAWSPYPVYTIRSVTEVAQILERHNVPLRARAA